MIRGIIDEKDEKKTEISEYVGRVKKVGYQFNNVEGGGLPKLRRSSRKTRTNSIARWGTELCCD